MSSNSLWLRKVDESVENILNEEGSYRDVFRAIVTAFV